MANTTSQSSAAPHQTPHPQATERKSAATQFARTHRLAAILFLGFASGLPLALSGAAMQAWLTIDKVDIATIGFFGLVGIPYTFKFLWAPLMDRFEPPWFGRRRGWLVLTQLSVAAILLWMSSLSPSQSASVFAIAALVLAFLSSSQDIVIDAYRTDVLPAEERGLGGSIYVFGYRLAMVLSGGIALIWADQWKSWPQVYFVMAVIMAVAAGVSLLFLPKVSSDLKPLASDPKKELLGFFAMVVGFAAGWYVARYLLISFGLNPDDPNKWLQLLFVLAQLVGALPLGYWASRRVGFATLNRSLESYFSQSAAGTFLALIVLYKLGDAFAGALTTNFLINGMAFTQAEVGIVNKILGIWLTIIGALVAGSIMVRISLFQALFSFGVLQLLSNFGFYMLASSTKGAWGSFELQPFDWIILAVKEPAVIDVMLLAAVAFENISGGMGTAAFVALLMGLCKKQFTATHYALLSAFAAVGRIYVSPVSGVLSASIGWPSFFLFSIVMAVPGLIMVYALRGRINALNGTD